VFATAPGIAAGAVLRRTPGSRYWAFQGIETGIFLLLAAALLAITFVVIMRRDA
jgi:hypothetical protein